MRIKLWHVSLFLIVCLAISGWLYLRGEALVVNVLRTHFQDNTVLTQHVGEVKTFDLNWKATWFEQIGTNINVFDVQGTTGSGVVTIDMVLGDVGQIHIRWAKLTLPSGDAYDLLPDRPTPSNH